MQLKDLKQDRRNYRKHNKKNLDLIKKSVNDVGLGRSIVIDNDFNYKEFDEWVRKLKYDVFISEYDTPFEKIASFDKMSLLNNSKDKKSLISENLYFHKAEICSI